MVYALPITTVTVAVFASERRSFGLTDVVDALFSATALVVLQLHIWDRRVLEPWVWTAFAGAFIAWELTFNLLIRPAVSGERLDPWILIVPLFLLPLYVGVIRYAARVWPARGVALTSASS
jgi:hypothetical protein